MSKKILILGGGYAGVEAALTLSKHKKKTDIEITVIDKNDYHTLLTELHEVAGNRIGEEGIIIPFERIFRYTPVRHVVDEITEYDLANKTLRSRERTYQYDHLVLAIGSTPNFYNVPGLHEHAFTLWSYEDALRIREHIKGCFAKARGESDPATLQKLLTFTVAGAGFTGVEMIGELAHWVRRLCRETGIPRKAVRLLIVDALPRVLHVLSEKNSAKAMRTLAKLGVEVMLHTAIKDLNADGFYAGETFIPCGTMIWAAGIRAAEDVDCMSIELGSGCRIQVDEYGRTQYPGVYAAGDIAALLDETGCPYPAMVENAIQSAHGAAMNILRDIRGQQPQPVKVNMHGVMVCIGNYAAVSEVMGKSLPSWLSVVMKFIVNIHYLWEIVGFSGVANYLHHEVLHRRQRKRLVEAHYSKHMQTWWLAPLRVFLGAIWLYEGLKKLSEGWLQSPKLLAFFKGANDFYASIIYGGVSSATGEAADAVSSATGEAAGAASSVSRVLLNWDWAWLKFWAVNSGETAFKIHFTPMQWVVDHWLLHSAGTQMFFQWAVVLFEIIIGLCLITGTLTFLASTASVGLQAGFVLTTGLYLSTWWMLFAGFAMMGGAGRAFGVDHYLLPYLDNYWQRLYKARRWAPWFGRALERSDR